MERLYRRAYGEGERTISTPATLAAGSATWLDRGKRWASFETEDLRFGVGVDAYLRARGL